MKSVIFNNFDSRSTYYQIESYSTTAQVNKKINSG